MNDNHLKTLSKTDEEIRVGNYMVLFGGKDLRGEYFTPSTQFESSYTKTGALYVDWEHGFDWDEEAPSRDDILGVVDWKTATIDERGLWVERVLSRRNEYMQYLEELIEEGLVGSSSEAVPGKVRVKSDGEIQVWPLKRDALTVTPAEPRMMKDNIISAIKALSEYQPHLKTLLQSEAIADDNVNEVDILQDPEVVSVTFADGKSWVNDNITILETPKRSNGGIKKMEFNEIDKTLKALQARLEILEAPTEETTDESISEQLKILTEAIMKSPKAKDGGYVAPDSELDHPEAKSFGDFLVAVRQGNDRRLKGVYNAKVALAEEAGASGGYLVPDEYEGPIVLRVNELSVLDRAGATKVPMARRTREISMLDVETAPSAGDTAYAGGVFTRWLEEAASLGESEPRFKLLTLIAHKLGAFAYASNEVRDDSVESVDSLLALCFARAIAAQRNYQFFRGNGVGKPRGILESGAWSPQTRSGASAVALADLAVMIANFVPEAWESNDAAFVANPSCLKPLIGLVSNPLSWMENVRNSKYPSMLMGAPLYLSGALPALNTAGDIMLIAPSFYYIGERKGIEIGSSEHFKYTNDQMTYRVITRFDGQPILDSTITLENASTTVSPYVGLAAG